tara:strand:+ start:105 stop:296 length:192 start_codon:yes stop_codon:yes gene_type:complete
MSINSLSSSLLIHPVLNNVGETVKHQHRVVHTHKVQTDAVVPHVDRIDILHPLPKGKHLDIKV